MAKIRGEVDILTIEEIDARKLQSSAMARAEGIMKQIRTLCSYRLMRRQGSALYVSPQEYYAVFKIRLDMVKGGVEASSVEKQALGRNLPQEYAELIFFNGIS